MVDILKLRKIAKAKQTDPIESVKSSKEVKSKSEDSSTDKKPGNKKTATNVSAKKKVKPSKPADEKGTAKAKKKTSTKKPAKTQKKAKSDKPDNKKEKASIKELLAEKKKLAESSKINEKTDISKETENIIPDQSTAADTSSTIEKPVAKSSDSDNKGEKKLKGSDNKKKKVIDDNGKTAPGLDDFDETLTMISFRLANNTFGVNITYIQEVVRLEKITRVPHLADFMKGVINLRGNITPVIDLRTRLNLEESKIDDQSRIIIAMLTDQSIGFIVDSVSQILKVPLSAVEDPPRISAGVDSKYIKGVATIEKNGQHKSGMVVILDLDKTFDKKMILEAS